MIKKTLSDVMPKEFLSGEYNSKIAFKFKDIMVEKEYCCMYSEDSYTKWPGKHKNVYYWVELENGYAVGLNENPARGWSFPVIKIK